jgi:hypothetical protein
MTLAFQNAGSFPLPTIFENCFPVTLHSPAQGRT